MITALDRLVDPPAAASLAMAALLRGTKHLKADWASVLVLLTGLLDSYSLEFRRREIEQESTLTREPAGVVLLDIESFKMVDEARGNAGADRLLGDVAYRRRSGLRAFDSIYRLGGSETLILARGTDLARARRVGNDALVTVSQAGVESARRRAAASAASVGGKPFDLTVGSACADRALSKAQERKD